MKVKIKNLTSIEFASSFSLQSEEYDISALIWDQRTPVIPAQSKTELGKIRVPENMQPGSNAVLWIDIFPADKLVSNQSLSLKIRFFGGLVSSQLFHSLSSNPYGGLRPEQEWHAGNALHSCKWITAIGSFTVSFFKKFNGFRLVLTQICRTSPAISEEALLLNGLEEVYENQARCFVIGRSEFESTPKALNGRPPFSTEDGRAKPNLEFFSPPLGTTWIDSWSVDETSIGCGESGWMYAPGWNGPWGTYPRLFDKVRRRRWTRKFRPVSSSMSRTSSPLAADSTCPSAAIDSDTIRLVTEKAIDVSAALPRLNFTFEKERLRLLSGAPQSVPLVLPSMRRRWGQKCN